MSSLATAWRLDRRAVPLALILLLAIAAWISLAVWAASPFARYVEHPGWLDAGAFARLCRAVPAGGLVVPAVLHALSWVLMIAAMMLPTVLPLLAMFQRVVSVRRDRVALAWHVVAGFFCAWLAFGVAAHGVDALLRAVAVRSDWFLLHGALVAAGVLAAAGLFQFSALKYRCLERCRTPLGFVTSRWHGRAPAREAFRLGVDHGMFCVGCCWALMLVMFVGGIGSIGWMLVLAAVMAAEKNLRWGRHLRTPVGLGLIAWAGVLALQ
jgi:predicted metal-binding membrane protein